MPELAEHASEKPEPGECCSFSQGEKVRMRASLKESNRCRPRRKGNDEETFDEAPSPAEAGEAENDIVLTVVFTDLLQ
jgi:hypothetical protein